MPESIRSCNSVLREFNIRLRNFPFSGRVRRVYYPIAGRIEGSYETVSILPYVILENKVKAMVRLRKIVCVSNSERLLIHQHLGN